MFSADLCRTCPETYFGRTMISEFAASHYVSGRNERKHLEVSACVCKTHKRNASHFRIARAAALEWYSRTSNSKLICICGELQTFICDLANTLMASTDLARLESCPTIAVDKMRCKQIGWVALARRGSCFSTCISRKTSGGSKG